MEDTLQDLDATITTFNLVKQQLRRSSCASLLLNIHDSDQFPKLRTYKLFKEHHEFEPYLHIAIPKYRYALSRFRLSSHNLEIEMGRYTHPKTPVERRLCQMCDSGNVEDEMHFLIGCTRYNALRSNLMTVAHTHIPSINRRDARDRFILLMSCEIPEVLFALGQYIWKAEEIKKSHA